MLTLAVIVIEYEAAGLYTTLLQYIDGYTCTYVLQFMLHGSNYTTSGDVVI